jgi:hypothetical protein
MSTRSKFVVTAAIAILGLATPAFAQSFNRSDGTGNELPSYYDRRAAAYTTGSCRSRGSWPSIETVRTLSQELSNEKGWA